MKDELGERIKTFYEDRFRYKLPRRAYTIIRVDGKAFHTYTKGLNRPFDEGLIGDMNLTAAFLCKNIMGAKLAYVQSDEISILITDFDTLDTQSWFDYNVQKMVSIAASLATSEFNRLRVERQFSVYLIDEDGRSHKSLNLEEMRSIKMAQFDARVFQIPSRIEVENYLIWRQQDAVRNSISSVAQSLYSHKELNSKKTNEMQEMIFQKGINWNDYNFRKKRGAVIGKVEVEVDGGAIRNRWEVVDTPIFTQDREFFSKFF
jgi:tRNA(His) 5'-end guanylyltransferase